MRMNKIKNKFTKGSSNLFKDFGFGPEEAKSLNLRSRLMNILIGYIQHEGLTQKEAAVRFGTTQPRISNLVHGRIDLFSVGILLDMMEKAGFAVYKNISLHANQLFKSYQVMRARAHG